MAGRGSGIGMGMTGGLGTGGVGGSATSRRTSNAGQVYGPSATQTKGAVHQYLWVLVALELLALVMLRRAFKSYHGG